jgi:hypothetical protein
MACVHNPVIATEIMRANFAKGEPSGWVKWILADEEAKATEVGTTDVFMLSSDVDVGWVQTALITHVTGMSAFFVAFPLPKFSIDIRTVFIHLDGSFIL